MKRRHQRQAAAPALVRAFVAREQAPEIARKRAADAAEVRGWIEQNLLFGRASLEHDRSGIAWESIFQPLYVAALAVEAEGMADLLRVIGGASGPLDTIRTRLDRGADHIITTPESDTLRAVTARVLESLDTIPDESLALAHQLMERVKDTQAAKQAPTQAGVTRA